MGKKKEIKEKIAAQNGPMNELTDIDGGGVQGTLSLTAE